MIDAADGIVEWAQRHWPRGWGTHLGFTDLLGTLRSDIRAGKATSIPVVRGDDVRWMVISPTLSDLKNYVSDLSAWVPTNLCKGKATIPTIIRTAPNASPIADWIAALAPEGYARWTCPLSCADKVFDRLWKMKQLLASCPAVEVSRTPSLPSLRMEFVTALRICDWNAAEECITAIDQWGLDQAASTLRMRLRLLSAMGDHQSLLVLARRHRAWDFPNPRRIATAILCAIHSQEIEPIETGGDFAAALKHYQTNWHPLLYQPISDASDDESASVMLAYFATIDSDARKLHELRPLLPANIGDFLCNLLPFPVGVNCDVTQEPPQVPSRGSDRRIGGAEFWKTVHAQVRNEDVKGLRTLLATIEAHIWNDPTAIVAAPEAILELLSDPAIGSNNVSRALQLEVIAALIDAFLAIPDFPRLSHLYVYQALLEGIVALSGESANESDSQLVLGLVGAVMNLSSDACPECEAVIRSWWRRRPIIERLNWLLASLDMLAPLHTNAERLADLFYEGLALAARKSRILTIGEAIAWRRVGRLIELTTEMVEYSIAPLCVEAQIAIDYLADARLSRIAIVSLAESGARDAAKELERRTGAELLVLNSLVAGRDTRHATGSDLILYVWAASTHATFRAFDNCRDRIAFVQGTGPASIVLAAERWAEKKATSLLV